MAFFNATIEIALVSVVITIISRLLQEKLVDKKKQKEHQTIMQNNQKKINELMKKKDEASKKEMEKLQEEALESMNIIMQGNTKYMLFSMPLFLVFFAILGALYSNTTIHLPIPLPVIHRDWSFEITSTISWLWWYIYTSMAAGIIINAITSALEKKGEKK
jgi:uncharacterized membrane protein (DUF106 family)